MKKFGFTLAEVLITLGIIGVVATMTLPALMSNTAEQQAKTGLKKGINTLTHVAELSVANSGYDFTGVTNAVADPEKINDLLEANAANILVMLYNNANVDRGQSVLNADESVVVFKDGTSIIFIPELTTVLASKQPLTDGMPAGYNVIYDTNGIKGPNVLSNCQGEVALVIKESIASENFDGIANSEYGDNSTNLNDVARAACTGENAGNRIIRDRFMLRLRGSFIVPAGAAATYLYNN